MIQPSVYIPFQRYRYPHFSLPIIHPFIHPSTQLSKQIPIYTSSIHLSFWLILKWSDAYTSSQESIWNGWSLMICWISFACQDCPREFISMKLCLCSQHSQKPYRSEAQRVKYFSQGHTANENQNRNREGGRGRAGTWPKFCFWHGLGFGELI